MPKWFKPRPPNYLKDGGNRKPLIILRNDQYKIEDNKLILKGLGKFKRLEIQFKGRIHLKGRQGRLEITYDEVKRKWYAHISFTVEEKLTRKGWVKIPRQPLGNLSAGIDLGVNNLMAVYVENGESFLVNGRPLKSIGFYFQKKVADYQSKLNKSGAKTSRKLRKLYERAKLQARHYINTAVRQTVERLYHLGVSRIIVGYPKGISRNSNKGKKQNFLLSHIWRFNYVIKRFIEVAEEHGILVEVVDEAFTSKLCPVCGRPHEGARFTRGLFKCPATGLIFNADLVGAFNILKKVVKTITPNLGGLYAQGRGNGPETGPSGGTETGDGSRWMRARKPPRPLKPRPSRRGGGQEEITVKPFSRELSKEFLRRGFEEVGMEVEEELIERAVELLDGIPGWLVEFGYNYLETKSFERAMENVILKAERFLEGELRELERRSGRYLLILKAIAMGFDRWELIKDYVEVRSGKIANSRLANLLRNLEKMGWIRKDNTTKRYEIIDPIVMRVLRNVKARKEEIGRNHQWFT